MRRPKTRAQAFAYLTAKVVGIWRDYARDVRKSFVGLVKNTAKVYYATAVEWTDEASS